MATAWELIQIHAREQGLDPDEVGETLLDFLSSRGSTEDLISDMCERIDDEGLTEELTEFLDEKAAD